MAINLISPLIWQATPFGDRDAFVDFLGHHAFWHQTLAVATTTPYFATDDLRTELVRHDRMHAAVARALNVPIAYDLVSFDLNDRDSYYGFMVSNALDHQRFRVAATL